MEAKKVVFNMTINSIILNAFQQIEDDRERTDFLAEVFDILVNSIVEEDKDQFQNLLFSTFDQLREVSDNAKIVEDLFEELGWDYNNVE